MTRFKILGALAIASVLASTSAQSAIVTGSFGVTNATLGTLFSGSLDAGCATPGGTFFACDPSPTPAAVIITPSPVGGGGDIVLKYDDTTGQVTEITLLNFWVSDMSLVIDDSCAGCAGTGAVGTVGVVSGNSFPVFPGAGPFGGVVSAAGDRPRLRSGTSGNNLTADVDSNPGSVTSFQHDAPASQNDATNFARFVDIVDTCVGTACTLIPVLSINALRYEIIGTVSGGTFNGTLRAETSNNSNYTVAFTSNEVPVPAAVWLFGSALGLMGVVRRRVLS